MYCGIKYRLMEKKCNVHNAVIQISSAKEINLNITKTLAIN